MVEDYFGELTKLLESPDGTITIYGDTDGSIVSVVSHQNAEDKDQAFARSIVLGMSRKEIVPRAYRNVGYKVRTVVFIEPGKDVNSAELVRLTEYQVEGQYFRAGFSEKYKLWVVSDSDPEDDDDE